MFYLSKTKSNSRKFNKSANTTICNGSVTKGTERQGGQSPARRPLAIFPVAAVYDRRQTYAEEAAHALENAAVIDRYIRAAGRGLPALPSVTNALRVGA